MEALGGINPGFKFVRDLDQESVPMKKAKDRKLDRHLVKSNRNEQGDFQCPTWKKTYNRRDRFNKHLKDFPEWKEMVNDQKRKFLLDNEGVNRIRGLELKR